MSNDDLKTHIPQPSPPSRVSRTLMREDGLLTRMVRKHRLIFTLVFFGVLSAVSVTLSFLIRFVLLSGVLETGINEWQIWWLAMLGVTVPVRMVFFCSMAKAGGMPSM